MPIILPFNLQPPKVHDSRPESAFYILSRVPGINFIPDEINPRPLNPKNLRSSFPPSDSRAPIPIGINHHLLKEPHPLAAADKE